MKLREKIGGGKMLKKFALAGVLVTGFLAFAGVGSAAARPRFAVGVGFGGPMAFRGYVAPAPYYDPVYVAPRYGFYRAPRMRHWDAHFRCWR